MLKIMRSHKFFSVFLLSVVTFMIIISFIFWGIGPKDNPNIQYVARVEDDMIMLDEYYRAYDNEYNRVRQQYSEEEIEGMNLPDRVIDGLIDRRVLLIAAERAGISVSEKEIQDSIANNPAFQRNGVFDVDIYTRRLKLSRLTPQIYENALRSDMIINKMRDLIAETAELSPEETKMLSSLEGDNKAQLTRIFLTSKSAQSIKAYIESIKKRLDIEINKEIVL